MSGLLYYVRIFFLVTFFWCLPLWINLLSLKSFSYYYFHSFFEESPSNTVFDFIVGMFEISLMLILVRKQNIRTCFSIFNSAKCNIFYAVGGGSSGLVISQRLSKHHKVLLIEAGGDPITLHNIPGIAYALLNHPSVDWMYESVSQNNAAQGYLNKKLPFPRGKSLGGSSNLNYMFYLRGNPQDYDNWANLTNDESWSYQNVLPYFKKSLVYNGKFSLNGKRFSVTVIISEFQ